MKGQGLRPKSRQSLLCACVCLFLYGSVCVFVIEKDKDMISSLQSFVYCLLHAFLHGQPARQDSNKVSLKSEILI